MQFVATRWLGGGVYSRQQEIEGLVLQMYQKGASYKARREATGVGEGRGPLRLSNQAFGSLQP